MRYNSRCFPLSPHHVCKKLLNPLKLKSPSHNTNLTHSERLNQFFPFNPAAAGCRCKSSSGFERGRLACACSRIKRRIEFSRGIGEEGDYVSVITLLELMIFPNSISGRPTPAAKNARTPAMKYF